jgi:hypothetical protein
MAAADVGGRRVGSLEWLFRVPGPTVLASISFVALRVRVESILLGDLLF